ncbi:sulfatase [Arenibacter palladensis]|uniref:sulfatase n=1 Tax=Arenibacter palladensis TaxID=237373 RepID=UPI0026E443A3|nr:sulfatase [Arenibacter palladensis]MDO6602842.1 sulfatase [Arenibacter palladensis]
MIKNGFLYQKLISKQFIIILLYNLMLGNTIYAQTGKRNSNKPNILFIAIDDMNDWTTLFDQDNPIKTPNLERLAKRGTFFSRAYCAVPACTPSRTAILSGYSPMTSGSYENPDFLRKMIPNATTLPTYFRNNGYVAKGAGKIFTHFNGAHGGDPSGKSFDEFQGMLKTRAPKENYNGYSINEKKLSITAFDWGEHDQKMIDIDMVEYVEKVMDEQWDKPMFLAAGIFAPHLPFYAPPKNFNKYPLVKTVSPPYYAGDLNDVPPLGKEMAHNQHFIMENVMKQNPGDPGSYIKMVQSYQASADFSDEMVGRLLDKLDASGKAENTIIILWADHGYHLGDKDSAVKFTLWEKANRVPFIIVAPGITTPGSVSEQPVSLLDIYPTLLELAGLSPKNDLDGVSLVPLLENSDLEWDHLPIMTMGQGNHAVRSKRWRYIRYKDGTEELYDHNSDPWEWKNLAADDTFLSVIQEHREYLPPLNQN